MRTVFLVAVFAVGALAFGCRDNEQSFFIQHMKVVADPPDCTYSAGDNVTYGFLVDLSRVDPVDYFGWFLTSNNLVARENYDNLVAESNGIFIDGAETSLLVGGAVIGQTAYRTLNMYLEVESADVIPAVALSEEMLEELKSMTNCDDYATTARQIASDLKEDGVLDTPFVPRGVGNGTVSVQIFGHTQGNEDVETNVFSFPISLCCGCAVDWGACASACAAFCETPAQTMSCAEGINDKTEVPCNTVTHALGITEWDTDDDAGVDNCNFCD